MEDRLPELPKGWVGTHVGEIYDIVGGGTPSTKVDKYWEGDIPWITSADIIDLKEIRPRNHINEEAIKNSATNLVPEKSIIVVTRVGLGKLALTKTPLCFSQDSQALIGNTSIIFPDYSLYYLSQAVQMFKYRHRGTTIAGVTKKQLAELPFALPPIFEQHRIVAKIEELFTRLDAGTEALKKVKAQLKRYRQAVLKYAFEGKLTQEWREANSGKLEPASILLERIREQREKEAKGEAKESPPIDTSELAVLPEGWEWVRFGELVEILDSKRIPVNSDEREKRILGKSASELVPYYGATGQVGWIDDYIFDEELVLLGEDGAPFFDPAKNKAYTIKGKTWVNNHAHVLRAINGITSNSFICNYLNIFDYHGYVTGTTRAKLNQEPMRKIPIPIPPLLEQQKIVEEAESRLSMADELQNLAEKSLKQSERLRQSILKQAFKGKLVPQDPTDEPAEKLLERIKEEKAKRETGNKKNKSARKKPNQMELI